jgi:hypothetical protein
MNGSPKDGAVSPQQSANDASAVSSNTLSEAEQARLAAIAKTVSLIHSLETAHGVGRWESTVASMMGGSAGGAGTPGAGGRHFSKKLQEAIAFSSTVSYEANRVQPRVIKNEFTFRPKGRRRRYVELFVDEWSVNGSPKMWNKRVRR